MTQHIKLRLFYARQTKSQINKMDNVVYVAPSEFLASGAAAVAAVLAAECSESFSGVTAKHYRAQRSEFPVAAAVEYKSGPCSI